MNNATRYKEQRDALLEFIKNADVSSGVCCCGDDMARHGNSMYCGHNPVDMWDHSVRCWTEQIEASDRSQERDISGEASDHAQFQSLGK